MQDRRADPRADVEVEIDLHYRTPQEFLTAYSRNISGGGLFIKTPQPQSLNQKVLLRFSLPGNSRKLEVHGVVVWANSGTARSSFPSGMGVKFVDLKPEDQQLITDFVTQTKAPGGHQSPSGRSPV